MQLKDLFSQLASDQAKLATDQSTAATKASAVTAAQSDATAAQQVVANDQTTIAADQAAISNALGVLSAGGFAVDVDNPNSDGTYNLAVKDTSPQGYHTIAIPSFDATVPTSPPSTS